MIDYTRFNWAMIGIPIGAILIWYSIFTNGLFSSIMWLIIISAIIGIIIKLKENRQMTIQQVVAELENIKEQTLNNSKITIDDVIEAIEDIITDCKDKSMDFSYDDEDHYGDYERETDFTKLEI